MPLQRGRGRNQVGPRGDVPRHNHPQYLGVMSHDQHLHQQGVLPSATETGEQFGSATSGSLGSMVTIVSTDIEVPSWAKVANMMVNGQADVTGAGSDEIIEARITIDGDNGPTAYGHFHSTFPDAGSSSPVHAHSITDPPSTITVTLDAEANGETVTADVTWLAIFERFA